MARGCRLVVSDCMKKKVEPLPDSSSGMALGKPWIQMSEKNPTSTVYHGLGYNKPKRAYFPFILYLMVEIS